HEPLDREASELVVMEGGNLRLAEPQQFPRLRLRKLAIGNQLVEGIGQVQFGLTFDGIWISEILEYVRRSSGDRGRFTASFWHSAPHNLAAPASVFVRPGPRLAWRFGCLTATSSGTHEARTPPSR